jgi:hypothetical protein
MPYLALCSLLTKTRAIFVTGAQLLGAVAAAFAVKHIIPSDDVLFGVKLATGVTVAQGFFLEMITTFELVITILMLAGEKTKATFLAPLAIGLALFIAHLAAAFWTGAGINPASHWVYCTHKIHTSRNIADDLGFGPFTGALLAAAFYRLLKVLHYEQVNGDQDKSADEESVEPLLANQAEKIERYLRMWGPRAWRNSAGPRGDEETWPLNSPRRAKTVQPLRLYRLSGLDDYKSVQSLHGKEPERRGMYSPNRYDDSPTGYSMESPRRW